MHNKYKIAVSVVATLALQVQAGQLELTPTLAASYNYYDVDSKAFPERGSNVLSIEPGLVGIYTAKRANGVFGIDYKYFDRNFSGLDETDTGVNDRDSFTEFFFDSTLDAIDDVLVLSASGTQTYRNSLDTDILVNDFVLGADQLIKTREGRASFSLQLPEVAGLGLRSNGGVGRVESDRPINEQRDIRDTNVSLFTTLYQGNGNDPVSWEITSSYQDTRGSINSDLTSRTFDASLYVGLYRGFRLNFVGRTEDNIVSDENDLSEDNLNFDSYGVGLSWFGSEDRFIDITFNESSSSNEEGEKEQFLGLNMRWQFSPRTAMDASYSRRFFGETGTFSLTHNNRRLRTRVQYTEDITNFSRLIQTQQTVGSLVCPAGAIDPVDCFQPGSLDYVLQPGESVLELTALVPQLTDEVILRKSLGISSTYQKRRLTTTLNVQKLDNDFLESNRTQHSYLASLNSSLRAGVRTRFIWNVNYNRTSTTDVSINDHSWASELGIEYSFSQDLMTDLTLRYVNRDSNEPLRDLVDRRVSFTINYNF